MYSIRPAEVKDIEAICSFDHLAQQSGQRRAFIERTVKAGNCFVIEAEQQVVGYAVLEYTFYEQGFVSMLYMHPDHRRQGGGSTMMRYLESICRTPKLFTSTNLSNLPMQSLLAKLGYKLCGVIHHLDEGDPELVYVKFLRQGAS
ncbi:MAG TPA: GNAT family N-acetyltransferase [Caldilineae bacterium]|jgi:ribosomal protein S18 acetylase RimI-like enzyme|nr:GNAT family N-acetyltransferase [Caldilineae bacterium]